MILTINGETYDYTASLRRVIISNSNYILTHETTPNGDVTIVANEVLSNYISNNYAELKIVKEKKEIPKYETDEEDKIFME